jgi:DNA-binding XRE family transcriptional regulator
VAPSKVKVFNRLRVLRTERGFSRQEVAAAVGVNQQTVGYLEREEYNPSLALAFKLAEFYSLPVDVLFSLRPLKPLNEALLESARETGEKTEVRS